MEKMAVSLLEVVLLLKSLWDDRQKKNIQNKNPAEGHVSSIPE